MKGRERILIFFWPGCDDLGLLLSSLMLKIFPSLSFKAGSTDFFGCFMCAGCKSDRSFMGLKHVQFGDLFLPNDTKPPIQTS